MRTTLLLVVGLSLLAASSASAASIYVNSAIVTSYTPTATVGGSSYRVSANTFDMALDRGTDLGGGAGSFISANLGNHATLNGVAYDFELQHVVGEGILFTMTPAAGGTSTTLSWGTFSSPPPGTNAPTLNGIAPGASFNSIGVTSTVSGGNRSVVLSNLVFSSSLTPADGSFAATTTNNGNTPGTQIVVADVDLSQFAWTFSGTVSISRPPGAGNDDTARLRISLVDAIVTIVPEPGTAALVCFGLLLLARAGRAR